MPETTEGRVAVYIDFDNIVISRYDQVHGRGHFKRDGAREYVVTAAGKKTEPGERIERARVDLGAVLDYASSFGTVAVSRAYADWSVPVNANYKDQLVGRAVDLVQMFPTVQSMKNGADIRMSVDVVEDLFRLPELSHVVIVSGDSDFIALAQRCRRLGRYVVGIGVAGGTSKALNAACNEYKDYDGLPGLDSLESESSDDEVFDPKSDGRSEPASGMSGAAAGPGGRGGSGSGGSRSTRDAARDAGGAHGTGGSEDTVDSDGSIGPEHSDDWVESADSATTSRGGKAATATGAAARAKKSGSTKPADQRAATNLLRRALELGQAKDEDWISSSSVKNQMLRMDPTFQESALGYTTFTNFVRSRGNLVELREEGQLRYLRLRGAQDALK